MSERLRRVKIYDRPRSNPDPIIVGTGHFHKWSIDSDIITSRHFPVAIVEMEDGTVHSVPTSYIKFLDRVACDEGF